MINNPMKGEDFVCTHCYLEMLLSVEEMHSSGKSISVHALYVCGQIKGKHTEMTEDTSTVYVCVFYGQVCVSACVCTSELHGVTWLMEQKNS